MSTNNSQNGSSTTRITNPQEVEKRSKRIIAGLAMQREKDEQEKARRELAVPVTMKP